MRNADSIATFALLACMVSPAFAQDPAPTPSPRPWTANAGFGLSLTRGNADTSTISLTGAAQYDAKAKSLFKADAAYLRGSAEEETTVDRTAAGIRFERKLTDRAFAFAEGRYLRDRFKDIRYLITPLAGVGYVLVKSDRTTFSVDTAVGAAFEKEGDFDSTTSAALKFGELLVWKISSTATLTQAGSALYKMDDFADALYHLEVALAASVTRWSELKVALADDYKNRPADPTVDKNDVALVAAFVMKF
jgi:putative salt-induced outer membrane protein YdiY